MTRIRLSRRTLTMGLSVFVSVGTIGYIVNHLELVEIVATFYQLDSSWLAITTLFMLLNYVIRTLRFRLLLHNPQLTVLQLFSITCLHGMFNYLMPAKTGELSFIMLLKQLDISISSSSATLITARLFDFATIAMFLPLVLIAFWSHLPPVMIVVAIVFCGLVYLIVGGVMLYLHQLDTDKLDIGLATAETSFSQRIIRLWYKIAVGMRLINQRKQYISLWLLTIGGWLCLYICLYAMVLSLGFSVNFSQIVVVSMIMMPMNLLPLQGLANLGTHEVGWGMALLLFGYSREIALMIAVGTHSILLGVVLLIGGLGGVLAIIKLLAQKAVDGG